MREMDNLIKNFSLYFRTEVEHVVAYREDPMIPWELILYYDDGSVCVYNDLENSLLTVQRRPDEMTDREWQREFGRRLRSKMKMRGIDQDELANLIGVSQGALSSYITGRCMPSFRTVRKIAKVLGCTTDELGIY